jgi:hypothetical protein
MMEQEFKKVLEDNNNKYKVLRNSYDEKVRIEADVRQVLKLQVLKLQVS